MEAKNSAIVKSVFGEVKELCGKKNIDIGYEVFTDMLTQKPELKKLFNYSSEQETKSHTDNILGVLLRVVDACDDPANLDEIITKGNQQHTGIKITEEEYNQFQLSLVSLIKREAGDAYIDAPKEAALNQLFAAFRAGWKKVEIRNTKSKMTRGSCIEAAHDLNIFFNTVLQLAHKDDIHFANEVFKDLLKAKPKLKFYIDSADVLEMQNTNLRYKMQITKIIDLWAQPQKSNGVLFEVNTALAKMHFSLRLYDIMKKSIISIASEIVGVENITPSIQATIRDLFQDLYDNRVALKLFKREKKALFLNSLVEKP